jgi:SAM-dependent methyltransferase
MQEFQPSFTNDSALMPSEDMAFGPVAAHYDALMAGVPYRFWVRYLGQLWDRHGLTPKTILDLACGTGTVSRLLTQAGFHVMGVDLSGAMLALAQREAACEALAIEFIEQDAAELDLGEMRFDAVISLFDSLNYLLDPERLRQAFARVCAHVNPGGSFIFDLNTEYALAEGMFNQSCTRRGEPLHYRWRSRYNPETRLCTVAMRFSYDPGDGSERQIFHETHRQRAYDKDEIVLWLQEAGFTEVAVYDSYSLKPAKKYSDRLFYVAVKKARPEA